MRRYVIICFAGAFALASAQATTVSSGGYHVVRVEGGFVKGLGDGTYGQLGTNPAGTPASVAGLNGITAVAAGGFSTLALKSDGTVWFLGESTLQHTTPHGTPNPVSSPVQVPGLAGIDAIAAGHRHFLALDADTGNLYAWGHNGSGQIGNGALLDVATPVVVLTGVATMDAGDGFTLAVKSDQSLWAWGRNHHGQLGLGDTLDRLTPTQVTPVTTAVAVAAGGRHSLILLAAGTVLASGNNDFGQLGLGNTTRATVPTAVTGLSGITAVSAGDSHSAAFGGGQASVWGRNFEGQCGGGNSSPTRYSSPQVLAGLPGTPTDIDCGYHFTLVELADGAVVGTGSNSDGQLDGSAVADQSNSRKVLTPQVTPLSLDLGPPSVLSLSPANGASGVAIQPTLALTFNENIRKGSGSIRIRENLANATVATIDIQSGSVIVSGAGVSIGLPAALAHGTPYYVEMDAGALTDLSDNPWAGIAGSKAWSLTTAVESVSSPSPIAHYTFDTVQSGQTPDSVGTGFATLGNRVQINTTVPGRIGTGALEILGSGATQGPGDGAVTSNNFAWANDARTVTFWWRAKNPNTNTTDGTFVSFGTEPGNGARFDIKEQSTTLLRVEVQGTGQNTNPSNFDDGNWHFVAITVPDNATFADITWYAGARGGTLSGDLNSSTNTTVIATGTGPLAFGDSIVSTVTSPTATNDRVPNGYLDDFHLFDEVLTPEEILFLYQNPGSVIGTSGEDFESYLSNPAFGLASGDREFLDDPDGDHLVNGLEAWFGTHPGVFNAGLALVSTNGTTTTFTHPQNGTRPTDISGFYQWSPNLVDWYAGDGVDGPPGGASVTFSANTIGTTSTVTATTSGMVERLFLRVGVRQN
jgi:alpha-tubulin suppressor-like RCC1 family protein